MEMIINEIAAKAAIPESDINITQMDLVQDLAEEKLGSLLTRIAK